MTTPGDAAEEDALSDVDAWDARAELIGTPCGEGRMVWRRWGQGPPVVLLHGGAGSWRHWIRTLPALTPRLRVLVPDLPGLGDSAMPPEPWSPPVSAAIVADGLRRLLQEGEPCALVGFSAGAMIAGLVAASLAERCRVLVLVGPGGLGTSREPIVLTKVRAQTGEAREAAHRANLEALMIADPGAVDAQALAIQEWNSMHTRVNSVSFATSTALVDTLRDCRAPLKAIWGARDAVARHTLDERCAVLRQLHPDVEIRLIPGAGHWVAYEAADAFNQALVAMLDGDAPSAGGGHQ